jgi:hypothetical protein
MSFSIPHSRRYLSMSQLSTIICSTTPSFATINSASPSIVGCNPNSLNQLLAEDNQFIFVYDFALDDFLSGNVAAARVVSHPVVEFLYNVDNFSSYTSLSSIGSGVASTNLPDTNLQTGVKLSTFISDTDIGLIQAVQQIVSDALANNFTFSTTFCPHIFPSSYIRMNANTGAAVPVNAIIYVILDNNDRVLLFGTALSY